jgi:pyruvate kinase
MFIAEKKTKIVATIGPATESKEQLAKLLRLGLNVVRMNFSHGDFAEHQGKIDNGRAASKETGLPIAFLQDLSGPKLRTGEFATETGRITLKSGQTFTITTESIKGDQNRVSINYAKFPKEVKIGHTVLIDDGKKRLVVTKIKGEEVTCKVLVGGECKGRRGVNLPDTDLSISALTPKDKKDLDFGVANKVDFVAFSFVRRPSDVVELRGILNKRKLNAKIIAKIETPQAIEHFDEILALVDGIMVARGDLAIEIPFERVPHEQKEMIAKCRAAGKFVITATQMLESMIKAPVPTRAEVSDVANAVLDGTDAVMLSEETTLGEFPLEAVSAMAKISQFAENHREDSIFAHGFEPLPLPGAELSDAVALATHHEGIRGIVVASDRCLEARAFARYRENLPIVVATSSKENFGHVQLAFACQPVLVPELTEKAVDGVVADVKKGLKLKKGEGLVVVDAVRGTLAVRRA